MEHSQTLSLAAAALAGLLGSGAAGAAIFTVGGDGACTHATAQQAIDAAEAAAGADTVRLTRSLSYSAQNLVINTAQHLNLVGGFPDCSAAGDGIKTTLSGAGGATEPVLRITGSTSSIIKLRHLTISGGDEDGAGEGGGILYRGDGILEIIESTLSSNVAGYGGGIYAEGTGSNAELVLSADVSVIFNSARYSGGGVYVQGLEMTMRAPGSIIAFNEALGTPAGGYGGGLAVIGGPHTAVAYIGSNGQGGLGAIYGNQAVYGGGASAIGEDNGSRAGILQVFATDPAQATAIRGNFASARGGGIYVRSDSDAIPDIETSEGKAMLWNATLADNAAPEGSAVYVDYGEDEITDVNGGTLYFNSPTTESGVANPGLPCPSGRPCGEITGHAAQDANGQPTGGALIRVIESGGAYLENVLVQGNSGGRILHLSDWSARAQFRNVLISGNVLSAEVVLADGDDTYFTARDSTVAGNEVGAAQILRTDGGLQLYRSILWQPGLTTALREGGDYLVVEDVIASEVASIGGGPQAIEATPRFIDPDRGDFRLRAASHAVDFAPPVVGDDRDLHNLPRDQDIAVKADLRGVRDIGAFERPTLQPLVLNGNFDGDYNLWTMATASSSAWSAENISGGVGSGSVWVNMNPAPQASVTGLAHCVHLPGPGTYALNGYGKSVGFSITTRDQLYLRWEYRTDGGEACNAGAPIASGSHFLTSSTSWTQPATPAFITVSEAEWTHNSSINVLLQVFDTSASAPIAVSGYFDGISLVLAALPPGELLKDGFESP